MTNPHSMASGQGGSSESSSVCGDSAASVEIVAAARNRSTEVEFGGDRAIGAPPNWDSQASAELYRGATVNNDPATAEALSQSWSQHSEELRQAAGDLYTAISELGDVWKGQGAGSAQGSLVAIANSSSQAGEAANSMSTRLSQQAAAAAQLKKMPGPKEFNPEQAMSAMLAGGPAAMIADQKAQFDAANDVKTQQVAYYNAYTESMSEVDDTTPSFGPEALGLPRQAGAASSASGLQMGAPGAGAPNMLGALGVGAAGAFAGAAGSGGGQLDTASVTQSGFHPEASTAGASTGPATASGAVATGAGGSSAAAGGGGSHIGQQLGFGAVGAGLGFAASKTLNAGNRSGAKQVQPGQTSAASDMTSQPEQGEVAPAAPVGQSKTQAGGVAGSPGMSGMPMGGAAGATKQEDEEHQHASFLVEPDPDDVFGANEATPHPVIGSWDE